jgi:PAS domain S-box-containing protein
MASMTLDRFDKLRRWYLARLRKNALEEALALSNCTPGTLIMADRDAVEMLVASNITIPERPPSVLLANFSNLRASVAPTALVLALILFICSAAYFVGGAVYAYISGLVSLFLLLAIVIIQYERRVQALSLYLEENVLHKRHDQSCEDVAFQVLRENFTLIERMNLIADFSAAVLCLFDKDLKIQAISPSVAKVLTYSPVELVGTSLESLEAVPPGPTSLKLGALMPQPVEAAAEMQIERRLKQKSGKELDTRWTIEWSSREQLYFALIEDITPQKETERLRDEFVAVISHDIRTPVSSIKLILNSLQQGVYGDVNDKGKRRIRESLESADFILDMIADLIDLHRLDVAVPRLNYSEVELQSVVRDSLAAVESLAAAKNIAIHNDVCSVTCTIDLSRIKRVIVNLVSNAIKFSPQGSSIAIRSAIDTNYFMLQIVDQGKGITAEGLRDLFSRFSPISNPDSRRDGSGLGLYVSKGLVESHGGTIRVTSEVGAGTTFEIKLPLRQPIQP